MFFDTTWLGFQDSNRARIWHDQHVVDVCQKMIIRGLGTWVHPVNTTSGQYVMNNRNRSDSLQSAAGGGGSGSGAHGDAHAEKKNKNML